MRTLIVTEFISLDGVIDSPGGGSHPRAGWTFTDIPFVEEAYELKGREQLEAGAMLIGRVSYDEFAPVWPTMVDDFAEYNAMPKYVVSSTLTDPEWNNTHVLRSLDDVAKLKEGDGAPIIVHGSATSRRASPRPAWSTATTCSSSRCCSATASASSATATRTRTSTSSSARPTPTASSSRSSTSSAERSRAADAAASVLPERLCEFCLI